MAKYLISFPSAATVVRDGDLEAAAGIAKACRCDQELRAFQFDPES